jgi:hypothetical protein
MTDRQMLRRLVTAANNIKEVRNADSQSQDLVILEVYSWTGFELVLDEARDHLITPKFK